MVFSGEAVPRIEYTENEKKTWGVIYRKLRELHKKFVAETPAPIRQQFLGKWAIIQTCLSGVSRQLRPPRKILRLLGAQRSAVGGHLPFSQRSVFHWISSSNSRSLTCVGVSPENSPSFSIFSIFACYSQHRKGKVVSLHGRSHGESTVWNRRTGFRDAIITRSSAQVVFSNYNGRKRFSLFGLKRLLRRWSISMTRSEIKERHGMFWKCCSSCTLKGPNCISSATECGQSWTPIVIASRWAASLWEQINKEWTAV